MRLRKVGIGDREVLRKYRVQTDANVSYWHEEFTCGAAVSIVTYGKQKEQPNYGISKKEFKISDCYGVHSLKGLVYGG